MTSDLTAPTTTYLICTTARSGSNLLCHFLTNTRLAGRPAEYLNPDVIRQSNFGRNFDWSGPFSTRDYIHWLRRSHTSPNGVFGAKLLHEDLVNYLPFPAFRELFSGASCILLRRRDKLKQAISYFFAAQTGQWVATDVARKPTSEITYDFKALESHVTRLARQDAYWMVFLNTMQIPYHEVFFEDFVTSPRESLAGILQTIGVEAEDFVTRATLTEQRIPEAEAMYRRLRADLQQTLGADASAREYKGIVLHP